MTEYQDRYNNSYAIIIGIDTYKHPQLRPLGKAEEDAQNFADVLSGKPYDFRVDLLLGEKATRRAITRTLSRLQEITDFDDRVIFFFAGHGYVLTDQDGNDVGYIACSDTDPDDLYDGLELDQVTRIRRFSKAKHIAFILDTCYSGAALGLTRTAIQPAATRECLRHKAYQILTAGAVETVSDAISMTSELVKTLREGIPGHSGTLTFGQLGQYIRDSVRNKTDGFQLPFCEYLLGSGKGEMVLMTPAAIEMLPYELRLGLTHADAIVRRFAIAEAEKQLGNPDYGEAVRSVLEAMQIDDASRDVRQRAAQAIHNLPEILPAKLESQKVPEQEAALRPVEEPQIAHLQKIALPVRDPILEILPPPFEWCDIPAGRIKLDRNAVTLDVKPFKMAKYPITYAQFQVFIAAGNGFWNATWWQGLAVRETQSGRQEWKIEDHPRENVSWYDAVAFCRWLSSQVGYEVRLPTEWEWQWAAQGPDHRIYPWGNEYIQGYANINEEESDIDDGVNLEETTSVGKYPQGASPYNVLDMAGNVWEWCLNEYKKPGVIDTSKNNTRVVRGGSWETKSCYYAQAAYSNEFSPNYRYPYCGFRVAGFPHEVNKDTG